MTRILLALLAAYRRFVSPALHAISGGGCKFVPTCSEYAQVAIAAHGPLRGSALAIWRLLRCHPFSRGGFDPVPLTKMNAGFARTPSSQAGATGSQLPPEQLP
ncbi:MAG TPA: membrane protein insertion efficiency factor YidD [Terracidiphilus sp.]|nr:membrane protein insertion efficiency factor YidD [Terracidiphilus sp.]